MDPETLKKILAILKEEDGEAALKLLEDLATGGPSPEAPADPTAAASDPPAPSPEEQAATALGREVIAALGAANAGEASTRAKSIFESHAETEKRVKSLEASERRGLVANLVQLGAETPATAWENVDAEGDARTPCKRLAGEAIADLRSRVEALVKASGRKLPKEPPAKRPEARTYSREIQKRMKEQGITPEEFEARKASVVRRSST